MKTIIPLNFSWLAQSTVDQGHERFLLAPANSTEMPKVTYDAHLRNLPGKTQTHPAKREIRKNEIGKAGGGNSLNSLKGGRCTPHAIYSASKIDTRGLN